MKTYKKIFAVLIGLSIMFGVTSCKEEAYKQIDDMFQPRLINTQIISGNTLTMAWYEVNDVVSYTIEVHLDNYYRSLFATYETTDSYTVLDNLPYATQFYIRIRSNAPDVKNNSTWTYTNARTEARPAFASLLQDVDRNDIFETSVIIRWTQDVDNPVDSIGLIPQVPELEPVSRYLTAEEIAQGFAEITGLEKGTRYNVNIYDTSKPGTYDKPYNQITFRTAGALAEIIIIDRDDDLSAILSANNDSSDIVDGTEYHLPAGSYYKVRPFTIKKGFKIIGSTEGIAPQILLDGNWNVEEGGYISVFEFRNIDFFQEADASYFFNSGNSWTMEEVSIYNCTFRKFQRGFWRHQGASKYKNLKSLTMENCIIDDCGGHTGPYGTFAIDSGGEDNIERVVFKNCTFMREANSMRNLFSHNKSAYPIHLEFQNITLYNYVVGYRLIDIVNTVNSTLIIEGMLVAANTGQIFQASEATTKIFSNNYCTTEFQAGIAPILGTELGISATDLFVDAANGNLTIKDPNSPVAVNRAGDTRWIK